MSWLTVIARKIGLGSVLDDIEAAEKEPSAANVGKAITGAIAAAPAAVTEGQPAASLLIEDLGAAAGAVVTNAAAKVGLQSIAADALPSVLEAIEAAAEQALKAATGGIL